MHKSEFEINDLFCPHAGYIALKNYIPDCASISSFLYNCIENLKKIMPLPDAQAIKPVHPATKMCTPGAGCMDLNLVHPVCACFYNTGIASKTAAAWLYLGTDK